MKSVMLAAKADKPPRYPVLLSPKLDGVRAIVKGGVVLSRRFKPIPNRHVQKLFGRLEGFDGELIVGSPTDPHCINNTTSGVMSVEGEPVVTYYVFDRWDMPDRPFYLRLNDVHARCPAAAPTMLEVPHILCHTEDGFLEYEGDVLNKGFEGVIIRDPNAPYKYGRATLREGGMLKVKRSEDSEMVIQGFEEEMHNGNERKVGRGGQLERSSHKANKTGKGRMGAMLGADIHTGQPVRLGTGFSDYQRKEFWGNQRKFLGEVAKYRFFPHGVKDRPRHPRFICLRDKIDL